MSAPGASRTAAWARLVAVLLTVVCGLALVAPQPAGAARRLTTGLMFGSAPPGTFENVVEARAGIVRLGASWRGIARATPSDPADPGDPAYEFAGLDSQVREATARGLSILLTVSGAPDYAEGRGRPAGARPGTWKPRPAAYGTFARAVASRYSGSYAPPGEPALPRVRFFQAWNEPNLDEHLAPQYEGERAVAARRYRALLNELYGAVKAVDRDNVVVTAGTAPYGDPPGGDRTRPLRFWRQVLCLKNRRTLRRARCPTKARFDVLAHHPINTAGGPRRSAIHPDDASTPDFGHVRRTLRAAERRGTVGTKGHHPLWATELWWESNPPDRFQGVPLRRHARWIEEALYLLWRQGARVVIYLSLRDGEFDRDAPFERTVTGLQFADGTPKPAFTAFRFPFVAERRGERRLRVWGRAPVGGWVVIERRAGKRWRRIAARRVRAGHIFSLRLPAQVRIPRGTKLRARVGDERSLAWQAR